jgi:hypothetical protein
LSGSSSSLHGVIERNGVSDCFKTSDCSQEVAIWIVHSVGKECFIEMRVWFDERRKHQLSGKRYFNFIRSVLPVMRRCDGSDKTMFVASNID